MKEKEVTLFVSDGEQKLILKKDYANDPENYFMMDAIEVDDNSKHFIIYLDKEEALFLCDELKKFVE